MNVLTCTAARRRMGAFHDEELPVSDQIAVRAHLEWCDPCAAAYEDMRLVRDGLRAAAPGRQALTVEEATTIRTSVVNRVRAEHTWSLAVRMRDMFDDMHFVYAGLGATVAMMVSVMAFAAMGDARRAWELFDLINPVRHADSPAGAARYKVEPYVIAADVYSVPPHTGRGGWTWYTGSAGWAYRMIIETFLGLKLEVDKLRFAPCLPPDWKSFKLHYRYRETHYRITLLRTGDRWDGPQKIVLDGSEQPGAILPLQGDRREHHAEVQFL